MLRADLPCSPCYLRLLSRCTHGHACMQNIGAGAVIARLEGILAKLPSRSKPSPPQPAAR
jgi:hypothetical protein